MDSRDNEYQSLRDAVQRLQEGLSALNRRISRLESQSEDVTGRAAPSPEPPQTVLPIAPPIVWPVEMIDSHLKDARPEASSTPQASPDSHVEGLRERTERLTGKGIGGSRRSNEAVESSESAEMRIGATWFNRIGAVILLLAVAFFVKYSFDQGWLSPTVRVILAAATGCTLIVAGEVSLAYTMRHFSVGLVAAGIAMLYVAGFSAHHFYGLITLQTAFASFCATTGLGAMLAVHGRMQSVAVLAIIGAFATPVVLSTGQNAQVALLTYLLVVDLGFLAVGQFRRWWAPRWLCSIGTFVLYVGWYMNHYEPSALDTTLAFIGAFYALFHADALISARRDRANLAGNVPILLNSGNIVAFAAVYFLAHETYSQYMGAFALSAGVLQWLLAWSLGRNRGMNDAAKASLGVVGAGMIALAVPFQLDGYTVALAWSVQSVVTWVIARRVPQWWLSLKAASVLIAAVMHLIIFDVYDAALSVVYYETPAGLWHVDGKLLAFIFVALCAYSGSICIVWRRETTESDRTSAISLVALGTLLLLGICAHSYDYYVATWCWLGLFVAWSALYRPVPIARYIALFIAAVAASKYVVWDLIVATDEHWKAIDGVVLNRAVLTAFPVAGAVLMSNRIMKSGDGVGIDQRLRDTVRGASPIVIAIVLIAAGTFEIVRIFKFEQLGLSAARPEFAKHLWLSSLWSLSAIAALVLGLATAHRALRLFSVGLFAITVLKVVLIDMQHLQTVYRIGSFAVLGVLLFAASLFYQRRWSRLNRQPPESAS